MAISIKSLLDEEYCKAASIQIIWPSVYCWRSSVYVDRWYVGEDATASVELESKRAEHAEGRSEGAKSNTVD